MFYSMIEVNKCAIIDLLLGLNIERNTKSICSGIIRNILKRNLMSKMLKSGNVYKLNLKLKLKLNLDKNTLNSNLFNVVKDA